jgi:hypothetical protein
LKIDLEKSAINMKLPNKEEFNYKDCVIAGDECWLITPKDMSVKWNDENARFRSCVVRKSDNFVVSQGFRKFTNFGEQPAFEPWKDCWKFEARHKLDGCCDENTILLTEDGNKTIKEICDTQYLGKVLGYNHETSQEEMVDILAHSVKSNNNDWYELELEDGKTITLTGNHKVYLPELDCYRRVEDLKGDEVFLLSKGG